VKAIRFALFGGPEVLALEDLAYRMLGRDEAVIRIEAASINPNDVKNVAGAMPQTRPPRTPGRDYAGVVIAGPTNWIGVDVWGSGDGGFTRDGSHAQQMLVPIASLRHKPLALSFDQAASVGVSYLAAWRGLIDAAGLGTRDTLAIIGASGGVGSAAARIARRLGVARIIGVDRRASSGVGHSESCRYACDRYVGYAACGKRGD
jgi:NADPH2:quinone reductase